jgi:hypothetical protein
MATSRSISSSDCDGHGSAAVDGDEGWLMLALCGESGTLPLFLTPLTGEFAPSEMLCCSSAHKKRENVHEYLKKSSKRDLFNKHIFKFSFYTAR